MGEARGSPGPLVGIYTLYRSWTLTAVWERVSSSRTASTHRTFEPSENPSGRSKAETMVAGSSASANQIGYSSDSTSVSPSSSVMIRRARRSSSVACSQPSNLV